LPRQKGVDYCLRKMVWDESRSAFGLRCCNCGFSDSASCWLDHLDAKVFEHSLDLIVRHQPYAQFWGSATSLNHRSVCIWATRKFVIVMAHLGYEAGPSIVRTRISIKHDANHVRRVRLHDERI